MRKMSSIGALFPRTRRTLLAVLLSAPERPWYISDLARHLGVPASSLQRELASLTHAGVLRREQNGNRVYYQAEPTFPLFPELRSMFAKSTGLVEQITAALEPLASGIDFAFLFGSYAREEQTARSDVDLLLVGDLRMATLSLPLRRLEEKIGAEVNVSLYSLGELREKWESHNHFVHTVMRERKIFLKGSEHELADAIDERKGASAPHEQAGAG